MCRQKKLIIEIDGIQHSTIKGLERDRQRDEYLSSEEYHVLRFNNSEISTNVDGIVDVIYAALQNPLFKKVTCIRTCYYRPPAPYEGDR
jgi:very-short-patch-repair endonuclease